MSKRSASKRTSSSEKNKQVAGGVSDADKKAALREKQLRDKERAAFDDKITRAELVQANAWLAKKHEEAEGALMDTLRGKTVPSRRTRPSTAGALYAESRHAFTGSDA